jgi:hypothetical protein
MNRNQRLELIRKSLGLRHKLKVHESMKNPDSHEELAAMYLAKWEFEDEIQALEEVLAEQRRLNVATKKTKILDENS